MSILDHTIVKPTGYRGDYGFNRSLVLARAVEETGKFEPRGFAISKQYELSAKLGVVFWAVPAQYDMALVQAKTIMLSRLYHETLMYVDELQHEIMNGDAEKCISICNKMRDQMLGKS